VLQTNGAIVAVKPRQFTLALAAVRVIQRAFYLQNKRVLLTLTNSSDFNIGYIKGNLKAGGHRKNLRLGKILEYYILWVTTGDPKEPQNFLFLMALWDLPW